MEKWAKVVFYKLQPGLILYFTSREDEIFEES